MDDLADASGAMTEAVVVVEQVPRLGAAGEVAPQTTVSAKFMRLSAPIDTGLAEQVVGSRLDLPAFGTCRVETSSDADVLRSQSARATRGGIELVDVGDLTLRRRGVAAEVGRDGEPSRASPNPSGEGVLDARVPLAVRAFPEVGELVSGLFYTSPDTGTDLAAGSVYTLEGTGAGSVERFAIDVEAPPALEDVKLGGAPLGDGVTLERAVTASLRWVAGSAPAGDTAADVIYVDVTPAATASVRCAFRDTGAAELPAWVVGRVAPGAAVTVHRVRERSFVSPGLDTGEVRFDVAVAGRATLSGWVR